MTRHIKKCGWQRTFCGKDITDKMTVVDYFPEGDLSPDDCKICARIYDRDWRRRI